MSRSYYETRREANEKMPLITAVHANTETVTWVTDAMDNLVRRLSSVYMNDLAMEIGELIEPLLRAAAQVDVSYNLDLNGQIRHGEQMLGGLLAVGLKMAAAEGRAERAERKVKA